MTAHASHLIVATPCYGGLVTQRYMQSICALLLATARDGMAVTIELLGNDSLVPRARNTLMATALDNPAMTHMMFIDADIGFTLEQVARLLSFDREVVAGMYPLKVLQYGDAVAARVGAGEPLQTAQIHYVGAPFSDDRRRSIDGFVTAEFAGTGFMLIKREALERMIAAYPETRYAAAHDRAQPSGSPNQYALFDCMVDPESREYLSEDYTFCRRWRAIGGEVWLDTRSALSHIGPREFAGDPAARFGL
ncbi:MAG: hypothetical protein JWP86_2436 [Phenylobacterium sp.]|nr:hypothetical protein [Phenylobacterium sp.]